MSGEDDAEFGSFQDHILSAYQPVSMIHQELVRRLVSVLWRLHKANAVETGLLPIQSKLQRDVRVPARQIDMLELFGLEDVSPHQSDNNRIESRAKRSQFHSTSNKRPIRRPLIKKSEAAICQRERPTQFCDIDATLARLVKKRKPMVWR